MSIFQIAIACIFDTENETGVAAPFAPIQIGRVFEAEPAGIVPSRVVSRYAFAPHIISIPEAFVGDLMSKVTLE